jgi:hypothetical protein
MQFSNAGLLILLVAGALAAADPPYAGTWKLDPSKSNLAGTMMTLTQLPSGEMEISAEGVSYKFKLDGNDYPDGLGDTEAWSAIDANTWRTVSKLNGKTLSTDTLKVSSGGKTLTIQTTGTKPNGEKIDDTSTFQRVSGGPGLAGKWKSQSYKSSSPGVLEFIPSGADGLTFKMVDMNMTCDSKLDGKDYPCSGPTLGTGWTIALTKTGARTLGLVVKKDGKPMYKYVYTPSADGKTMTETGGSIATNEKLKAVLVRQ